MRVRLVHLVSLTALLSCVAAAAFYLGQRSTAQTAPVDQRVPVVIDAGHGGRDPGAVCAGVEEADINLEVARRVAALAAADGRLRPILTRSLDVYVSLADRIACAEEAGAALYLSIQSNACDYPLVRGVETWVDLSASPGSSTWRLAEVVQASVVGATAAVDRGVREQELYLHAATVPAALIELGFLTNREDRTLLLDPGYRETIAAGIVEGMITYLGHAGHTLPPP